MVFLLTDSPQKLKLGKIHGTLIILFYISLSTPCFVNKKNTHTHTTTLQQMTGDKTLNLVLKKMLEPFLKIHKNIRILIMKRRLKNLYKKENFKPEIKLMIESL